MKLLSRNILKLIAIISMLIDHIGYIFFPEVKILRQIGRLAFPIFSFFIAEGYYHTKSLKKYILRILIFAIITEPIYIFAFKSPSFNILFTFSLSILIIYLIENINKNKLINISYLILILIIVGSFTSTHLFEYGLLGVLMPAIFYFIQNKKIKFILIAISISLIYFGNPLHTIFSFISIILLLFYNGKPGKLNLKYLFYSFYPLHLLILLVINLLI